MAKGAYIGVPKPEYEPVFKNNSWAQIIKACQKNEVPSTWAIGSQKDMTINGKDYAIDIIGKNHDTYTDGSGTAPLTFQMHECYDTAQRMNSSATSTGGWTSCEMRNTTLPALMALMPSEVQAGIKEVSKRTVAGSTGTNSTIINTTADKLFLLSEVEVFGSKHYSPSLDEGSQYAYYAAGNSKIKHTGTTAQLWWERSPLTSEGFFCAVSTTGDFEGYQAHTNRYVSFAFCFGGTSQVNNTFGGNSVARKIKKGYVGVDGKARKIKKAYTGIGGVARPCWSGGELAYYGTITALSQYRHKLAATSTSNHALFGGGYLGDYNSPYYVATVNAYDKALTRTTPTSLAVMCSAPAATSVNGCAFFGGGANNQNTATHINMYNQSLTLTSKANVFDFNRYELAATSVGNYAVFAGGWKELSTKFRDAFAFDTSLTKTTTSSWLGDYMCRLSATTVGNYALFGGAMGYSYPNSIAMVNAYDASLTKQTNPANLSVARYYCAATTVGNYALFGGGEYYDGSNLRQQSAVDAYDKSLTRTTATALSVARDQLAATTVEGFALFGGGRLYGGNVDATVDCYDASLTRTTQKSLSQGRYLLAATTIGNYALFGGGYGKNQTEVDAYVVA